MWCLIYICIRFSVPDHIQVKAQRPKHLHG